ncbi:hypothetical protein D3C76_1054260 [compost metagenome]
MLFVECDLLAHGVIALGVTVHQVEHQAVIAAHGDGPAHRHAGGTPHLMVRYFGNMGALHDRRIQHAGGVLDLHPRSSIRIVADPGLRHVKQHPRIEASAAARAALKQNVREACGQRIQQRIQAQHVAMRRLLLLCGSRR